MLLVGTGEVEELGTGPKVYAVSALLIYNTYPPVTGTQARSFSDFHAIYKIL